MPQDKQLRSINLKDVLEKRRLDQALNAKEFAVCAGMSYSTARSWFRLPGFPVIRGVVFWQDFVEWRVNQNAIATQPKKILLHDENKPSVRPTLPLRALRILQDAR